MQYYYYREDTVAEAKAAGEVSRTGHHETTR